MKKSIWQKWTGNKDCSTAYENSKLFIPARKKKLLLHFFHFIYLILYIIPMEKRECRWMTDKALSPGHLSGHILSPWERSLKQLLLTLSSELLRLVARISVVKRMSLFRHVHAASDIFCLSMNIWHHLPHCIGAVTIFYHFLLMSSWSTVCFAKLF